MKREPQYYPKWIREIIFCPFNMREYKPYNPMDTLNKVYTTTYRTDAIHALIFDLAIEVERNEIKHQAEHEQMKLKINSLSEKLKTLEDKHNKVKK